MCFLFVTGMSRSGTTLVDKILCNHPRLSVLSQPFPFLFLQAKKDFFEKIGHPEETYYLNNLFLEDHYTLSELNRFLTNYKLNKSKLKKILYSMKEYSGQYTQISNPEKVVEEIDHTNFIVILKKLLKILKHKENVFYSGCKEGLCEEFLEFLMQNSFKTILIVRDPRDMIVSTYFGNYKEYIGKSRPILFHLRNWRKSVAFAANLMGESNFKLVRYEDLVNFPRKTIDELTNFLGTDPFSSHFLSFPLKDQAGKQWKGNSSFDEKSTINKDSFHSYGDKLSADVIRYIEYTCFPEMRYLGYHFKNDIFEDSFIKKFIEPFKVERQGFSQDFSTSKENIWHECKRFWYIKNNLTDVEEIKRYFLFEKGFYAYRNFI